MTAKLPPILSRPLFSLPFYAPPSLTASRHDNLSSRVKSSEYYRRSLCFHITLFRFRLAGAGTYRAMRG